MSNHGLSVDEIDAMLTAMLDEARRSAHLPLSPALPSVDGDDDDDTKRWQAFSSSRLPPVAATGASSSPRGNLFSLRMAHLEDAKRSE